MSILLRTLRKNKFVRELQPEWVLPGEVQADALKDLQSNENELSVWEIADDLSNLDRVLAALAANRDSLANIDFALIDIKVIEKLGINPHLSPGNTPDPVVSELHRDLTQLTASRVAKLAAAIVKHAKLERRTMSQVRSLLCAGVQQGQIDSSCLKENLVRKLKL